jgi:hypothetical protein
MVVVWLVGAASPARAQEGEKSAAAPPADPSGSWKWEYTFNDNTAEFFLTLAWDGEHLTGKYTAFDNTTDIDEAKLDKNDLSFVAHREFNGNKFDVHFNGKVEPEEINGTVSLDFGDGPQEFDWNAKRTVNVEDVLGTWELRLETPNGVIEPRITITKDGDKLHGAYVSPFGEREAKNLELKDNELTWEISGENEDFRFKVIYHGKPRGNSIAGTNEFDFNGNTGTMEFTGKRTPPEEKLAAEPQSAAEAAAPAATPATPAEPATPAVPAEQ